MMFRTVMVKLAGNVEPLSKTAVLYTQACQLALNYGFKNRTHDKNKINGGTYEQTRRQIPQLPAGLVQCARDQATEMLKREKCRTLSTKKRLQVRYDRRGRWSYRQLLTLLTYKAENLGKRVMQVNPKYTSQKCSKCGYIDKRNRKGLQFKCKQCGFELNADLNAARNIGELGKSELVRLSVNQPIVAHTAATSHNH